MGWYFRGDTEHVIDMVEQVSPGPYAELFARRARFGWDYPIGDHARWEAPGLRFDGSADLCPIPATECPR